LNRQVAGPVRRWRRGAWPWPEQTLRWPVRSGPLAASGSRTV